MNQTYKYHEFDLGDSSAWTDFLNKLDSSQKDIYFTPEYYRLYEELGDGKAMCFIFELNDDIVVYPFLINSVNQLGYDLDQDYYDIQGAYGYNGYLTSNTGELFLSEFEKAFAIYCEQKNIIAEFTRFHPLIGNNAYPKSLRVIDDRETVFVDLSESWDNIWMNQFSSKNRNMIRKAEKMGYRCQIVKHPIHTEIDDFIQIYYRSMKMVNATEYYLFNDKYFQHTFQYLTGSSFLFNIINEANETVCSSIFFKSQDYFHYHLSGRSELADNSVNNFLLSEAIKFAKEINMKLIHLGGGRTNAEDDSLLKFKKSFSKVSSSFSIGKKIHNQSVYNLVEKQWAEKYPEQVEKNRNFLLKYRTNK